MLKKKICITQPAEQADELLKRITANEAMLVKKSCPCGLSTTRLISDTEDFLFLTSKQKLNYIKSNNENDFNNDFNNTLRHNAVLSDAQICAPQVQNKDAYARPRYYYLFKVEG